MSDVEEPLGAADSTPKAASQYNEESIQILEGLEAVRKRPACTILSTKSSTTRSTKPSRASPRAFR